ncbi:MAG: hypothetical protein E7467_06970 [Ruminococcaceae bacterium]|nr:hypothetical protein [Oscillospiraceae bacterium]
MQKHKILAFLAALVVSVALWVYAVTFVNPDDTTTISDIRVRFTGTSLLATRGLMLTGGEEQFVDVEVSGRRSDLKELNSSNVEAVADVGNIDTAGSFEVSWTLNPPATVASGDIRLINTNSNRVKVKISERRDREIPLEIVYAEGEMVEGYLRGESLMDAQSIAVSGPAEEVSLISKATIALDLTEATQTFSEQMSFSFVDEQGEVMELSDYTTWDVETVGVTVQVLPYRDLVLEAVIKDGGGMTKDDVSVSFEPRSVRVTGTAEALDKLEQTLRVELDLATIQGDESTSLKRSVELPQGVTRMDENNSTNISVDVKISVSEEIDILRLQLSKAQLEWINGAEGVDYFFAEPDQIIEIRGKTDKIKLLRAKINAGELSVIIRIDVGLIDQTGMCPLQIVLPEGFGVGIFKEYSARIADSTNLPEAQ